MRNANIAAETLADIMELRRLLKLNSDAEEFSLVQAPISSSDTEIAILPRSITGIMQNMAADVQVPDEDLAKTRAFPGYERNRGVPDTTPMIRIHSGKERSPEAFVSMSVNYRNTQFWMNDSDLHSKQVFLQLTNLFTMADTSAPAPAPVVTIPSL